MIVATDARWPAGTGIGVVQQEVVARKPVEVELLPLAVTTRIGSPLSSLALGWSLRRSRRVDLFWSPGFVPPWPASVPYVVTVHDLIHLHYYSALHAEYYRRVFRPLLRRAEAVICVSSFTRDELLDWGGLDPARVTVIRNGVSSRYRPADVPGNADYVLYPGNRRSYKNLRRLLAGYARSRLPREGVFLAFTGPRDPALSSQAAELGVSDRIRFLGVLTEDELVRAYQCASAIVFVSLYEGFGLPLLEGMACGIPVLASRASALPEIAGDAALLVTPTDVEAIGHGLDEIVFAAGTRQRLREAGLHRAATFTWDSTARATWALLDAVGARVNAC